MSTPIERAQHAETGTYCGYGHQVIVMAKELPEWARREAWKFLHGEHKGRFMVTVKTATRKVMPIPLPHAMYPVGALKRKFWEHEGVPVRQQMMIRLGERIRTSERALRPNDKWLSDWGMGAEDCAVFVQLMLRGPARTKFTHRRRPRSEDEEDNNDSNKRQALQKG